MFLFIFSGFLFISKFYFSIEIPSFIFYLWVFFGFIQVMIIFKTYQIILGIFLLLNLVVAFYFHYILQNFAILFENGPFDFSAYSFSNINVLNSLMYLIFMLVYFVLLVNYKSIFSMKQQAKWQVLIGNINVITGKIKNVKYQTLYISVILLVFISLFIFTFTFNVHKGPYGYGIQGSFEISNFMRAFIGLMTLIVYGMYRIKKNFYFTKSVFAFKVLLFLILYLSVLSFGSRGSLVGIISVLLIFETIIDQKIGIKLLNMFTSFSLILILIILWPFMRTLVFESGLIGALVIAFDLLMVGFGAFDEQQFRMLPMIPMTLFHFLYVIDLIKDGVSLNYQTFINLIPQQLPESLANAIGYERPLNDNWRLADHFFHGGGFYIFANAYWNGGILALSLFTLAITKVLIWIENIFKNNSPIYYLAYPLFIYLIPVNTFYGIQPFVRGLEYGLLGLAVIYIFKNIKVGKNDISN